MSLLGSHEKLEDAQLEGQLWTRVQRWTTCRSGHFHSCRGFDGQRRQICSHGISPWTSKRSLDAGTCGSSTGSCDRISVKLVPEMRILCQRGCSHRSGRRGSWGQSCSRRKGSERGTGKTKQRLILSGFSTCWIWTIDYWYGILLKQAVHYYLF